MEQPHKTSTVSIALDWIGQDIFFNFWRNEPCQSTVAKKLLLSFLGWFSDLVVSGR